MDALRLVAINGGDAVLVVGTPRCAWCSPDHTTAACVAKSEPRPYVAPAERTR